MTTHSSLISPTMPSSVSWTEWITVEDAVAAVILIAALVIGLATAGDYGATIDEFNANDYGPKALAWYTSGFADRSQFETVEFSLWYYGPWFQIVTATVQSLSLAEPLTVRHAMTFVLTGYLYGNLFFAPIDSPFLATMSALGELSIRFI